MDTWREALEDLDGEDADNVDPNIEMDDEESELNWERGQKTE